MLKFRSTAVLLAVVCAACGGGGGGGGGPPPAPPTPRDVTISWTASHEKGVNSANGGYQVSISGVPTINVPYVSGPTAPTSIFMPQMTPGTYSVTVRAFAALDPQGGGTQTFSAASQTLNLNVP
jgi:hypothetical protein